MGTPATPPGAQCDTCQHYRGLSEVSPGLDLESDWLPACAAYPLGIPDPLLRDAADHRQPYRGDGGVRYTPR